MIDAVVLDGVVRGVAAGGFTTIGVALAASPQPAPSRWIGVLFFLSAIGHALDNSALLKDVDGHVSGLTHVLSIMGPGMFWAFALTLFADEPVFPKWRLIPPAISLAVGLAGAVPEVQRLCPFWAAYNLISILLVGHALVVIWRGWRGDLVEPRRRLRAPVMGAAAIYVAVTAGQSMADALGFHSGAAPLVHGLVLAALAVAGALALLRPDPVVLGIATSAPAPSPVAPRTEGAEIDPAGRAILARLARGMDEEEIWRREDLNIRMLADHVGAPEHRLRRLINSGLGHRNFAAFVNARRIAAAMIALSDPAQARKPVSSIAYELGFGSLGPFNRAFKDATGMTPTAWRQRGAGAGAASPNSAIPLPG
jgi:AraC-like DNA-binding protein